MASTATNPKIEELRARLKADPKSRIFFPLAEELRKAGNWDEAEKVLRNGLTQYPTYLGAWVGLGRVLHEQRNDVDAVDALNKALQLDPGNVVAARLLADSYLALGEKVEAIKKYKLVHALLPSDDDLRATIEQLDRELHPPAISEVSEPAHYESASEPEGRDEVFASPGIEDESPFTDESTVAVRSGLEAEPAPQAFEEESPFDKTAPPFTDALRAYEREVDEEVRTGDAEPMGLAHEESPFEDPGPSYTSDALEVEDPLGMQITDAPLGADVASMYDDEELPVTDSAPSFDESIDSDAADTVTMADLYVRQGLVDQARQIYENILARDPGNDAVRDKLLAIAEPPGAVAVETGVNPKVARLENWLSKITGKEADRV